MDFSSLPAYLDTTPNLNQKEQVIGSSSSSGNNLIPHHAGGGAVLRPGSMAERARLANTPIPESALRCPRCDSTNTKFCYYNNYNLSQPRHFCKSCRRYWTRGGALRNVPVGGGCRRNKRSKAKSQTRSHRQTTTAGALPSNTTGRAAAGGLIPQLPPVRLIPQPSENFNVDDFLSSGTLEPLFSCSDISPDPWHFHHAPPLGFVDPVPGFESPFILSDMLQGKHPEPVFTQVESVKTEGNPEMNFPRQVMGAKLLRNDQWSNFASSWNDFCSPSTSNRM